MDQSSTSKRLLGVDTARLTAILGMFAAHVFPLYELGVEGAYSPTATGFLAAGRASVLFMVLAGISLVLLNTSLTRRGSTYPKVYSILARRASIIAVLGMLIGAANEAIANILVHYGILFLLLPLALKLSRATLWVVSVTWLTITPILWQLVDVHWLGQRLDHNPSFSDLLTPQLLFKDLFVTGYYPLLVWIGYGLLGMAIGRTNLSSVKSAVQLSIWGIVAAIVSWTASLALIGPHIPQITQAAGIHASDAWTLLITGRLPGHNVSQLLIEPYYQWLPSAHSQSLLSTIHTAACSVAIIGLMQLVIPASKNIGAFFASAGRAPLTLYVGHILLLPLLQLFLEPEPIWWILCAATACTGSWLYLSKTSGPLEQLTRSLSGASEESK